LLTSIPSELRCLGRYSPVAAPYQVARADT
jgi:hypothetical protein